MSELLKSVPAKANDFVFGTAHLYDDGSVFIEVNEDLSDEEKEVVKNLLKAATEGSDNGSAGQDEDSAAEEED